MRSGNQPDARLNTHDSGSHPGVFGAGVVRESWENEPACHRKEHGRSSQEDHVADKEPMVGGVFGSGYSNDESNCLDDRSRHEEENDTDGVFGLLFIANDCKQGDESSGNEEGHESHCNPF